MVREQARDPEAVLARLADDHRAAARPIRERALKEMASRSAFVPVVVAEHLTWDDVVRVSANMPVLPGVIPEVGLSRFYPDGPSTSHVVGYVGPVSEADLAKMRTPTRCCRSRASRSARPGSRRSSRPTCAAQAGTQKIEVSAAGRVMRELGRVEGTPGKDLELTLDLGLQAYAMRRMAGLERGRGGDRRDQRRHRGARLGAGVRGQQLRLRHLVGRVEGAARRRVPAARRTRPSPAPIRPGSTFKICMALAALEAGVVSPRRRGLLRRLDLARQARASTAGSTAATAGSTCARSLAQSCDCYYYEMGRRLGPDRISAMAHRLGLGVAHDLPIPAVSAGNMPDAAWKKAKRKEPWTTGDSFNYGIGQGFTLASPLQLAVMAARVASGTRGEAADHPRGRRRRGAGRAGRAARRLRARTCTRCATACTRSRTRAPPTARASSTRRC